MIQQSDWHGCICWREAAWRRSPCLERLRPEPNGCRISSGPAAPGHGGACPQDERADHRPAQRHDAGASNDVTIRARVKGFLKEKHFDEGSNVKKDQLLLVIDEAAVQGQGRPGQGRPRRGRGRAQEGPGIQVKEVAKAQVALDETQLQLDRVEERRERNLLARKAASQEDYDQAKAKAEKSAAQVEAAKASLEQALADYDDQHPVCPGQDRQGQGRSRSRPRSSWATAGCSRRSTAGPASSR